MAVLLTNINQLTTPRLSSNLFFGHNFNLIVLVASNGDEICILR